IGRRPFSVAEPGVRGARHPRHCACCDAHEERVSICLRLGRGASLDVTKGVRTMSNTTFRPQSGVWYTLEFRAPDVDDAHANARIRVVDQSQERGALVE